MCKHILLYKKGDDDVKNLVLLEGSDLVEIGAELGPKILDEHLKDLNRNGTIYDPAIFWRDSGFYPNVPIDPSIEKAIEETGIDQLLAYYLPISIHGSANWGIRYLRKPMQSYINKHFQDIQKLCPEAEYKSISRMVFESVRRHELEHCVQEMTYLASVPYALAPPDYSSIIAHASLDIEPLAANFEVTDTSFTVGSRRMKNIVAIYLSKIYRPHPYSNWNAINVGQSELAFENQVQSYGGSSTMKSVRKQVLKNKGTGLISIHEMILP